MGEANKRGSKVVRIEDAKREKEENNGTGEIKQALMVVYVAKGMPILDSRNAFVPDPDNDGEIIYHPDPSTWQMILDVDLPEWVKQPENVSAMKDGQSICCVPGGLGRWYRADIVDDEGEAQE